MPLLGVYLVKPAARACAAASLMCWGVSKSGSRRAEADDVLTLGLHLFGLGVNGQGEGGESEAARWEIL